MKISPPWTTYSYFMYHQQYAVLGNVFNNMKGIKLENGSQIYPLTMQTFLALVP